MHVPKWIRGVSPHRFAISSFLNYVAANAIFTIFWITLEKNLSYIAIAAISATASIGFSLVIHKKVTFPDQGLNRGSTPSYYGFHSLSFALSLYAIPRLSRSLELDILILQYLWTFLGSLIGVLILNVFRSPR